eukprot:CFRG7327T1
MTKQRQQNKFGGGKDMDVAELLLTVDGTLLCYSYDDNTFSQQEENDNCDHQVNKRFTHDLHNFDVPCDSRRGMRVAEGRMLVLQVELEPGSEKYGCVLNIDNTNICVVNTIQLTRNEFMVGPPGAVFHVVLARETEPELLEYLTDVLHYFGTINLKERETDIKDRSNDNVDISNSSKPTSKTAKTLYMTSGCIKVSGQYVAGVVSSAGAKLSGSIEDKLSKKAEETERRRDVQVSQSTHQWLARAKYGSGTLVGLTRDVISKLKLLCETAGRRMMGSRIGRWMESGIPGGRRHAFMNCFGEGLVAYGSVYTSFGNAGRSVLVVSADGAENCTRAKYGEDAGKAARTAGSISKDLGEMAYHAYSVGVKTTVKSFGKGVLKGL